jgi:hypothetical protein
VRRDPPLVKTLKTADAYTAHVQLLGVELPFMEPPDL